MVQLENISATVPAAVAAARLEARVGHYRIWTSDCSELVVIASKVLHIDLKAVILLGVYSASEKHHNPDEAVA